MAKKKKRILFGAVDIGWRIEHYTKFIQEKFGNELEAESFVKFKLPETHYKTKYTYVVQYHKYPKFLQWCISFCFFIYALFRYDIFYFLSGEPILTRKLMPLEFRIYKLFKKKIVMHFVGTDIRSPKYLYYINENVQSFFDNNLKDCPPKQEDWQKRICKVTTKYADKILVSTPDLLEFFPKSDKVEFLPVFLDVDSFKKEIAKIQKEKHARNTNDSITILHAPSNENVKGTKYIEKILNEIKNELSDIEIIITSSSDFKKPAHPPYTVTRYELIKLLFKADIVIDQILIGWYGLQSVESLFMGNETICYIDKNLYPYLSDCPIYKCEKSLKESIFDAIENLKKNKLSSFEDYIYQNHTIENSNFAHILNTIVECI